MFPQTGYKQAQDAAKWTDVYVEGIPIHATKNQCIRAFSRLVWMGLGQNRVDKYATKRAYYGEIIITRAKYLLWNSSTANASKSRGNKGCFNFETHKQAKKAIEILNGFDLDLYLKRNYLGYKHTIEGSENDEYYKKPVVFAAPNQRQTIAPVSRKNVNNGRKQYQNVNYFDNGNKYGARKARTKYSNKASYKETEAPHYVYDYNCARTIGKRADFGTVESVENGVETSPQYVLVETVTSGKDIENELKAELANAGLITTQKRRMMTQMHTNKYENDHFSELEPIAECFDAEECGMHTVMTQYSAQNDNSFRMNANEAENKLSMLKTEDEFDGKQYESAELVLKKENDVLSGVEMKNESKKDGMDKVCLSTF